MCVCVCASVCMCVCVSVCPCVCVRGFVSVCPCVPAAGLPASQWEGAIVFVPRLPGRVKMAPGNAALD